MVVTAGCAVVVTAGCAVVVTAAILLVVLGLFTTTYIITEIVTVRHTVKISAFTFTVVFRSIFCFFLFILKKYQSYFILSHVRNKRYDHVFGLAGELFGYGYATRLLNGPPKPKHLYLSCSTFLAAMMVLVKGVAVPAFRLIPVYFQNSAMWRL